MSGCVTKCFECCSVTVVAKAHANPRNSTWFTRLFSSREKCGLRLTSTHNRPPTYWPLTSCSVQRNLEGHVGDVYTCRFFPSGIVVLSGGADMRLKIWSAEDGSCPRTLIGHTRGWLNSSIIWLDVWLIKLVKLLAVMFICPYYGSTFSTWICIQLYVVSNGDRSI